MAKDLHVPRERYIFSKSLKFPFKEIQWLIKQPKQKVASTSCQKCVSILIEFCVLTPLWTIAYMFWPQSYLIISLVDSNLAHFWGFRIKLFPRNSIPNRSKLHIFRVIHAHLYLFYTLYILTHYLCTCMYGHTQRELYIDIDRNLSIMYMYYSTCILANMPTYNIHRRQGSSFMTADIKVFLIMWVCGYLTFYQILWAYCLFC